jgi:CHAD domain-containing protein
MIKWLTQVSPDERAVEVAARSLESRLHAVRTYLRRSVKKPKKPENVHQLRVWSRRADAAIELYADFISNRVRRRMRRMLKRIRRAAGRVRDVDVFAARLVKKNQSLPKKLKKERDRAQRKLVTLYDKLDGGRKLKRRTSKLIKQMLSRNESSTERFGDRARDSLRPMLNVFFSTFPGATSTESELHRFRIAGKDVRYAMELLAGAFRPEFRDEIYPMLVTIQEMLGQINDLSVARDRLRKQSDRQTDPAKLTNARRRVSVAEDELALAREVFHRWWTAESREALRTQFEQILS